MGLIRRIIEVLGLDMDQTNAKGTPAERKPLVKDENGEPQQDTFNYASVVGMLLYLSGHIRPDLAYSVSQVARFMFNPKHLHKIAIKQIGRYLIGTKDKGMIIKPTFTIDIDAYHDAAFAGLYGYEDNNDPVCTQSHGLCHHSCRMSHLLVVQTSKRDGHIHYGSRDHCLGKLLP